jgi:hypothetical protein
MKEFAQVLQTIATIARPAQPPAPAPSSARCCQGDNDYKSVRCDIYFYRAAVPKGMAGK